MSYISLHNHTSDGSIMDGYQTVDELVTTVKENGQSAVSITEHGTMRSVIRFYKKCKEEGIKPIIGCEFYFCPSCQVKDKTLTYHLVLLAMNNEGYMNLKRLDTLAYDESNFYFKPRIDLSLLKEYNEGLICLSACMASIVNTDDGDYYFKEFHKIFGDRFYAEIQPLNIDKQQEYNDKVVSLARKYNVPLVVTTDAHFAKKEDQPYHELWVGTRGFTYHDNENYLWTEEELLKTKYLPKGLVKECIESTQIIADRCEVEIELSGSHYPTYPTNNPLEKIKDICRDSWKGLVPKGQYKKYFERFENELEDLSAVGYLNYLLVVWSVLDWCRKNNIPIGEGRGSAAGCLVSYLMGIHKIDPIKRGTEFFRFCNRERVTPCDIDMDVSTAHRKEIIDFIKQQYGHVCKVQTIGYTKNPSKDDVGKAAAQLAGQALARIYEDSYPADRRIALVKSLTSLEDILTAPSDFTKEERERLYDVAINFAGRVSKVGIHASCVLVTPDDVVNYSPIEGMTSVNIVTGQREYTRTACYEFHTLEDMGCLKLDVLGLGTLDVVDDVVKKVDIDLDTIPMDDKKTFDLYASGNLLGVFQMDSQGMRNTARELKVSNFEDIAALVALFRPGPIDSGMLQQFIVGKNGGDITYSCSAMEEITSSTYGVIVYQEQVMKLAMVMAGYTLGQADILRKVIGRKEVTKIDEAVKEFIEACVKNGYAESIAEEVAEQIRAAGRYIFNKAHAVSYGQLSYKTAYLKVHYPLQYMCALLNSKSSHEDLLPYINEAQRMGIKILPPSYEVGNLHWIIEGKCLRVGLTYIKGVARNISVIKEPTWDEVVENNNKKIVEGLIKSGALDFLGKSRGWMMSNLSSTQDRIERKSQCLTKIKENTEALKSAKDEKEERKYKRQLESWEQKLQEVKNEEVSVTEYNAVAGEIAVLSFSFTKIPDLLKGFAHVVQEFNDKRGNLMARVVFNTEYGEVKGLVFASMWRKKIVIKEYQLYEFVIKEGIIKDAREID